MQLSASHKIGKVFGWGLTFTEWILGSYVMTNEAFLTGLKKRMAFWQEWLHPDSKYSEFREARFALERPLPYWAEAVLPRRRRVRILDVNAGPVSGLGIQSDRHEVDLVPIDDLAHQFEKQMKTHGYEAQVPTQFCSPEDVLCRFGPASFDLIYSYNGLANTRDPIRIYEQLLRCLRPGGRILTFHNRLNDAKDLIRQSFHHFHVVERKRLQIVHKGYRRDIADALPGAKVRFAEEESVIRVELRAAASERLPNVRMPRPLKTVKPPQLISVHIPKTAGSSFRRFLESLYGPTLRCLYTEEETAPRHIPHLQVARKVRCLHGHFQATAFDEKYPRARKITWLRDPMERIVSSYYQYHRWPPEPDGSPFLKRLLQEGWSILDFARSDEMVQQVRWYLNGIPLEKFFFIGITEHYDASLKMLCHLLNVDQPENLKSTNINPERGVASRYALPETTRQELEALYAPEVKLYQLACDRLSQQLAETFGESARLR